MIGKDEISVDKQIPHVWLGKEGASYITGGVVVTKDPETGVRNVGWYRLTQLWNCKHPQGGTYTEKEQKKQLSIFAFWNPPMNHIGLHLAKAQRMGKPLEIAIGLSVRSGCTHGRGDRYSLRSGRIRLCRRPARLAGRAGEVRDRGSRGAGDCRVRDRRRVPAGCATADHRLAFKLGRLLRQAPGLPAVRRQLHHPPQESACGTRPSR